MSNPISVSQFNTYVHNIFLAEELLYNVALFGEIGEVSWSGNSVFFTLKDEFAVLNCVSFNQSLEKFNVKEGDSVIVHGSPNYYIKGGRFSFNVSKIETYGKGTLFLQFLELKSKLEKLGYFDESKKKKLPENIKRVGVITSETGAVIRDIIDITRRRNPMLDIVLYPAKVQGENADETIISGLQVLDKTDVDLIIIARGGGSNEDLAIFNSEKLAKAVFETKKLVISAVGHEVDFTICDFVADIRAPTPSAAAELVAVDLVTLVKKLEEGKERLVRSVENVFLTNYTNLNNLSKHMVNALSIALGEESANIATLKTKLVSSVEKSMLNYEYNFDLLVQKLSNLNPVSILRSGWASVSDKEGKKVVSVDSVKIDDNIIVQVVDGKLDCRVMHKEKKNDI